MHITRPYVLSPYALALRDKPNLFAKKVRRTSNKEAIVLEQYLNDLYHHFLYNLTKEMQQDQLKNETKLQVLFTELIKVKKQLQEIE
jgi:hypothetical protein